MAERRFGPIEGAGVVVIEQQGDRQIIGGALGTTCLVGIYEKGPVGELNQVIGKTSMRRRAGGQINESFAPDNAIGFIKTSRGAGELFLVRVTDGSEVKSEGDFYNRSDARNNVLNVKAANGGRWGGKVKTNVGDVATIGTDILTTTIDTAITMLEDEWVGGSVILEGVASKSYEIIGNTTAGVVTVTADSDMIADLLGGGDPTNKAFILVLVNGGKALAIKIVDGNVKPTEEWGIEVYGDDELLYSKNDLSSDPSASNYYLRIINDDDTNDQIEVTDDWIGAITANTRPQNAGGKVDTGDISANTLGIKVFDFAVVGTGDGTVGTPTPGAEASPDVLTLICTDDFTPGSEVFSVASNLAPLNDLPDATVAVPYAAKNDYMFGFTITAGSTNFVVGDVITIYVRPLPVNGLIGGLLTPDTALYNTKLRIVSNTVDSITVKTGVDLSTYTSIGKYWRAEYKSELRGGYDGIAGIADSDYEDIFDIDTSPMNNFLGQNKGLVKMAVPGITSATVQQAGIAFAEASNYQFREEIPSTILTEQEADIFVSVTVGRSEFAKTIWPSYAYVADPQRPGAKKLMPMSGAVLGREALVASIWEGYHKAAAGIEVDLPEVLELPTGDRALNEEFLNPRGINIIKSYQGKFIIWGDRTLAGTEAWKFAHQREMMSHYEWVLRENFDWIIFAINDPRTQDEALSALSNYFIREWSVKRALQGDSFQEAAQIKIDEEINTPTTRAQGDLFAEITLWLADTVERFIITVGRTEIAEEVLAA